MTELHGDIIHHSECLSEYGILRIQILNIVVSDRPSSLLHTVVSVKYDTLLDQILDEMERNQLIEVPI